jgi:hypothetical protein
MKDKCHIAENFCPGENRTIAHGTNANAFILYRHGAQVITHVHVVSNLTVKQKRLALIDTAQSEVMLNGIGRGKIQFARNQPARIKF